MARLKGAEKAAILIMVLGEEYAPQIIKNLNDKEIRKIGQVSAKLGDVAPEEIEEVVTEFMEDIKRAGKSILGTEDFMKNAVSQAHGEEKAKNLLNDIYASSHAMDILNTVDAKIALNILIKEQPQTIALILAYINPEKAARILSLMPEEFRGDIVIRMANLDPVSPEVLQDMEEVLESEIKSIGSLSSEQVGGIDNVAELFNQMDKSSMTEILSEVEEEEPELADSIRALMFVFDDLIKVDNKGIQTILKEVSNDNLVLALKGANDELRDKILSNVSSRAAEMLKDDLETMGPVKLSDVENAQGEIVRIAMKLEEEGKIVLGAGGEEMI
jgi:flagellar motor switch protein FliG